MHLNTLSISYTHAQVIHCKENTYFILFPCFRSIGCKHQNRNCVQEDFFFQASHHIRVNGFDLQYFIDDLLDCGGSRPPFIHIYTALSRAHTHWLSHTYLHTHTQQMHPLWFGYIYGEMFSASWKRSCIEKFQAIYRWCHPIFIQRYSALDPALSLTLNIY